MELNLIEASAVSPRKPRLLGRESVREMVVVIVSILIAFGLDAWWDDVSERRQLREQLAGVVQELDAGRLQLEEAVMGHRALGSAAQAFRQQLGERADGSIVSVADTLVGALFSHYVMDVSTTATVAFVEAGGLGLIDRSDVVTALRDWPDAIADAVDDQAQLRFGVQSGYQPYMMSAASLGNALQAGSDMIVRALRARMGESVPEFRSPPRSVEIAADPQLGNLLSWRVNSESTRLRQMEYLLETQEWLISELRAILDE